MKVIPELDFERIETLISLALSEDLSDVGDTTTLALIPEDLMAEAVFLAKEDLIMAGMPVAERVFRRLDKDCEFTALVAEGEFCPKGSILGRVRAHAGKILTAERTALNFLQRLCGVATCAHKYAKALEGSSTRILDTRKTTPGYRNLEKYAVAVGGAYNHRIGLFDRIMMKDNHRELAGLEGSGGIARSVERARKAYPELEIEVEADRLEEVAEALEAGADYILLDNMSDEMMAEAVKMAAGRSKLEASGGITLERLPRIGKIGVDFVSAGALTHSVKSSDISLDIIVEKSF